VGRIVHPLHVLTSSRVAYFFINNSSIQFKICAIFQLSVDMSRWLSGSSESRDLSLTEQIVIVVQRMYYGNAPQDPTLLPMEDDLEQALALSDE
jgi:hypothetical protein